MKKDLVKYILKQSLPLYNGSQWEHQFRSERTLKKGDIAKVSLPEEKLWNKQSLRIRYFCRLQLSQRCRGVTIE
jgi:hypothetical protein